MDKISKLLETLDNKIPSSLGKKIDSLDGLEEKIEAIEDDLENDNTPEKEAKLKQIKDYASDLYDEIVDDLEELVEERKSNQAKAIAQQKKEQELAKREAYEKAKKEAEEKEKKESGGWGYLLLGGVLLAASLGAINIMKKR